MKRRTKTCSAQNLATSKGAETKGEKAKKSRKERSKKAKEERARERQKEGSGFVCVFAVCQCHRRWNLPRLRPAGGCPGRTHGEPRGLLPSPPLDVEGLRFFRRELDTWPAQRRLSHPLIAYRTYRMHALSQNGYGNSCFQIKLLYIYIVIFWIF